MIIHHAQILIEQLSELEIRIREMEKYFEAFENEEVKEKILLLAVKRWKAQKGLPVKKSS